MKHALGASQAAVGGIAAARRGPALSWCHLGSLLSSGAFDGGGSGGSSPCTAHGPAMVAPAAAVAPPPRPPPRHHRLVLYASKLAACAGMHPFVPQATLRDELLHALLPPEEDEEEEMTEEEAAVDQTAADVADVTADVAADVAEEAQAPLPPPAPPPQQPCRRPEYVSPEEAAARALEALEGPARKAARDALASSPADAREVAALLRDVSRAPGMTAAAREAVRGALYTAHGTRAEPEVRAATERDAGLSIRTDARFRTCAEPLLVLELERPGGRGGREEGQPLRIGVYVGGRHDGLDVANTRVVEIKARQRRLLGCPEYERVQLHAYMAICGVRRGLLVEDFAGRRALHEVPFDDALWARTVDAAGAFLREALGSGLVGVRSVRAGDAADSEVIR